MINLMIVIFCVYVGYVFWKCGVLPSLSDSWYELPGMQKHLFTLFIIGLGACMAEIAYDMRNIWFFDSGALLCFVGIAAEFKKKSVEIVHVIGAVGGIAFGAAGLLSIHEYELISIGILGSVLLPYLKVPNKTLWVEIGWFALIAIGLKLM